MLSHRTNDEPVDAEALALAALAATLTDERRARRFLDLTGLDADELRARAGDRGLLAALLIEPLTAGTGALSVSGSATIPGGGPAALQFMPAGITVR